MKTLLSLLCALCLCGCASTNQKNAGAFLSAVAAMHISGSEISQSTVGPFYNHAETIAGLDYKPGGFTLVNIKASFNIPLPVFGVPLFGWQFSATNLSGETVTAIPSLVAPTAK
jgi:hypothetical protein